MLTFKEWIENFSEGPDVVRFGYSAPGSRLLPPTVASHQLISFKDVLAHTGEKFINVTGVTTGRHDYASTHRIEPRPQDAGKMDYNNGVFAVVDEQGDTWVTQHLKDPDAFHRVLRNGNYKTGAYVPLSNQEKVVDDEGKMTSPQWPHQQPGYFPPKPSRFDSERQDAAQRKFKNKWLT